MRLAALYRGDARNASLHVAVGDGFVAVDELAATGNAPDLEGLHDVGELFSRGPGADAAAAPPVREMTLRTLVNGEVRQDASCSQMITGVPELIAHISAGITLEPGDVIATGTPSGVAAGMTPPVYLAPGDKVSIGIAGIGELVNTVAEPR